MTPKSSAAKPAPADKPVPAVFPTNYWFVSPERTRACKLPLKLWPVAIEGEGDTRVLIARHQRRGKTTRYPWVQCHASYLEAFNVMSLAIEDDIGNMREVLDAAIHRFTTFKEKAEKLLKT